MYWQYIELEGKVSKESTHPNDDDDTDDDDEADDDTIDDDNSNTKESLNIFLYIKLVVFYIN